MSADAVLGSTTTLKIETAVASGVYTEIEQLENVDDGLTNDTDETTNNDSAQKKEHIQTLQGLEVSGSFVQVSAASYAASGQKLLIDAARAMTEGLRYQLINANETELFVGSIGDLSNAAPHDAAIRKSFTITRCGDSTFS